MNQEIYTACCQILKEELVPALGCTEPIAIAYAAAKAREVLGQMPKGITVHCSGNIIKNVKGVTVPNSGGMMGIEAAAILGTLGGDACRELEVLQGITAQDREQAKQLVESGYCRCLLARNIDNLYVLVRAQADTDYACVEIKGKHTHITRIEKNGVVLREESDTKQSKSKADRALLSIQEIILFADSCATEDVKEVIQRQIELNTAIAEEGIRGSYGASVGRTLLTYYDKEDVRVRAKAKAAAASDARMSGCALPVVINSGSGNQGVTVSLPVIEYARHLQLGEEEMMRALVVSNLVAVYQKRHIGNLSAFCGAVSAAAGAASGIIYLYGGRYQQISAAITNTLANLGGVVCDGAKASCAAKIASSVDAAVMAGVMAGKGISFPAGQGLVKENVEKTVESIGRMGREGMRETDVEILEIMLEK